jgi:hypothetical protein
MHMIDHGEINKLEIVKKTTSIILYCLIPHPYYIDTCKCNI